LQSLEKQRLYMQPVLSAGCLFAGVCSVGGMQRKDPAAQAVEKSTSAALRASFVTAAYEKYTSFLMILRALHLRIFEQPATC